MDGGCVYADFVKYFYVVLKPQFEGRVVALVDDHCRVQQDNCLHLDDRSFNLEGNRHKQNAPKHKNLIIENVNFVLNVDSFVE